MKLLPDQAVMEVAGVLGEAGQGAVLLIEVHEDRSDPHSVQSDRVEGCSNCIESDRAGVRVVGVSEVDQCE